MDRFSRGQVYHRFLRYHPAEGLFIFIRDRSLLISIPTQNTQVLETKEFRKSYSLTRRSKNGFKRVTESIWCYRGAVVVPKWNDVDKRESIYGLYAMKYGLMGNTENYTELCTIEVDLSHLPLSPQSNVSGGTFYRLSFDTILLFGLTELEAVVAWKENVRPLLVLLIARIFIYTMLSGC